MLHCRMEVDEFALHDLICIKSEDHYLCDAPINSIHKAISLGLARATLEPLELSSTIVNTKMKLPMPPAAHH